MRLAKKKKLVMVALMKGGWARMLTRDYRMITTDAALRRGLERHGDERLLTLPRAFQGLPDTAHGGSVLAAFHAVAGAALPAGLRARYRRRVPLEVPLRLVTLPAAAGGLECRLEELTGAVLVDGGVSGAGAPDDESETAVPGPAGAAHPLPLSPTCFVCGTDNPLGLRARLQHDEAAVRVRWTAAPPLVADDGRLAPVALTGLLDEVAFWLGALASGESGMTTELDVAIAAAPPAGATLVAEGARAAVRPRPEDPRYWDTTAVVRDESGRLVASARVTFVAVRGAARRLVTGLLRTNPPDVLARVFPAYA